ncbi:putative polyketide synthase [Podospora fimiseda]|uniref:Polyketide synthase n=1 Tax=Podospora fimiseda TaxID=252190 RepID=A0AAN7BPB0_9PEZI|nr:putative polyketide synthase [Podospora fimiseda]
MEAQIPIAIIGMSCRFAGDVDSPEKLWKLLAEGRSAWSEIPKDRFNIDGFHHPNFEKLNATNVIGGHFLSEDVGLFDVQFFNLSAETAAALDPQFRLQLESTYEALESAGLTLQDVAGSNTSVFAGSFFRDYHESLIRDPDALPRFLLIGTGAAMASNRLSHFFDLRGPSMSVDTGCSTTLTALHQGCQSLRTGESSMSIVGGTNIMLNPDMFLTMSSMTLLGADGKSFAFDSRANGYGRGEGSATVILKRLDDAIRDGDPIRAIIRDSGINQDGKTETITTPSGEAQEALIRSCYRRAGLNPVQTTYFEAHGTGTKTGDPIEAKAIASVFKDGRNSDDPLRIGSVKTNIGHAETASGVAAIIKVALALEKEQIPPSINFKKPNDKLHLEDWKLKIPTTLESWPVKEGICRASINNFGYGGSNAHVIMESFKSFVASKTTIQYNNSSAYSSINSIVNANANGNGHANGHSNGSASRSSSRRSSDAIDFSRSRVFILSGKDEQATNAMVSNLREHLLSVQTNDENAYLDNLAWTLGHRRSRFAWTSALAGDSIASLAKTIESGKVKAAKSGIPPRLGFVYTGQGAQWWAMGRELIDIYPVFKATLLDCDKHLKKLGAKWSMIDELSRDQQSSKVHLLEYSVSVCAAVQIALTNLLRSWDITATAVTSHSSGEIAAAYAAGALDLKSAMTIAYARGGTRSDTSRQCSQKGGMMAVGLGAEEARQYLSRVTKGKVVVACENSPTSVTLSGDICGLDELEPVLKSNNIFARRLIVDTAWHSHHMESVADAYYAAMNKRVRPAQRQLNFIYSSPSTGERVENVSDIGQPAYWVNSLTGPVQFVDSFRNMCYESDGSEPTVDMVIEVGPHAALKGPIQDIMTLPQFKGHSISYGSCLIRKQNAVATMHALVGDLIQRGFPVNLLPINFPYGREGVQVLHDLPRYPWNHQTRHWIEPRFNKALRERLGPPHDLLGSLVLGTDLNAPSWRNIVRVSDIPWVRDHIVQGAILYPAAGYLSMAIEGVSWTESQRKSRGDIAGYKLRDVDISNALVIPETAEGIEVQLSLRPCDEKVLDTRGWTEFRVQSVTSDNKWTEHCNGLIMVEYSNKSNPRRSFQDAGKETAYRTRVDPKDIYSGLQSGGICHGPIFRNIKSIHAQPGAKKSLTAFTVADAKATMPKGHQHPHVIHPTTLDSVFQAAYTALSGSGTALNNPKVPRSIGMMWIAHDISSAPDHIFKTFTVLKHNDSQTMTTSLAVLDSNQQPSTTNVPVLTIDNFVCQFIGNAPTIDKRNSWEQDKFTIAKWAPDISFIKEPYLKTKLGSKISPQEAETLMDLRQACLYYIYDALSELTPTDISNLAWHHRKFYIWMGYQVELARANELAPNSSEWVNASLKHKAALFCKVEAESTNGEMVCRLGRSMVPILRGEITPLELMTEDGLLNRYYLDGLKWGRANAKLGEFVKLYAHKHPRAKMLEIGAGTGGATTHILQGLGTAEDGNEPSIGSYDFTDVSTGFFEKAKEKFKDWNNLLRYKKLNVEEDPVTQGFEEGGYDIIIACQVLHATKSMKNTMANVRRLLKPGGKLFLVETTKDPVDIQFVFGFLPGWWLSEEEERKFSPSLTLPMWDQVLYQTGFRGIESEVRDCDDDELYAFSVISTTAATPPPKFDFDIAFVTTTSSIPVTSLDQLKVSISLMTWTVPAVYNLNNIPSGTNSNTVYILLDDPDSPILSRATQTEFQGIKTLCTQSKGLLWLTQGGADTHPKPFSSLVPGFLRALRQEYSGKRLACLDLDPSKPPLCFECVKSITEVFRGVFDYSCTSFSQDYEYAVRQGVVGIPRYVKDAVRNKTVFHKNGERVSPKLEPFMQKDRPLRLTVGTTGLLDTLAFDDDTSVLEALPDDFVEIEPKAFGVNFRDVMVSMGQLKSSVMGYDCSGVVIKVGTVAASQGFKPGDRVSVLLRGHYASTVRIHWTSAVQIPDDMSFEVAASLPTQFVAAYVGLYDNARLQKGERVFIHSATGGVGQAAVMLAQRVGAEVFVTVGSEEKKQFVKEKFGIEEDHIFSSRDISFAEGIMDVTNGKGVDVVLNSLAGPLLQESFNCLSPFGRFVELGKRDLEGNNSLAMGAFTRAVSFSSVDVIALGEVKPMEANRILKDVVRLVAQKEIDAVFPISVYPLGDVEKAFRLMQAGKHMGKIVLSVTPEILVPVMPRSTAARLRADASYLVVGGFGGIGRSVCDWMVEHGARNLVVLSRTAAGDGRANELKMELKDAFKHDVNVMGIGCDISIESELSRALITHARSGMPPIRGIIHGGMELKDSVLEHMTLNDHQTALGPKVQGSWNLHKFFSGETDFDFYIMLSSLVGVIGYASQANYAAGGSFQDALAQHRVENGLPGVSIDLGIVKSVGYLAGEDEFTKTLDSLQRHGFMPLREDEVLSAIESAIVTPFSGALALGISTGPKAQLDDAPLSRDARFSALRYQELNKEGDAGQRSTASGTNDLAGRLGAASTPEEAIDIVVEGITKKLMDIFMVPQDEVVPSKSLAEFGVDSLVAVELRNTLAMKAGAELSIFDIMQSVSITALGKTVVEKSSIVNL